MIVLLGGPRDGDRLDLDPAGLAGDGVIRLTARAPNGRTHVEVYRRPTDPPDVGHEVWVWDATATTVQPR